MRATLEAMLQQAEERDQRGSSSSRSSSGIPAALGPLTDLTRDEGLCLYALGRWAEAAEALGSYLAAAPGAADASMIQTVLAKVRTAQRRAAAAAGGGEEGGGEEGGEEEGEGGGSQRGVPPP
jgi:hypothetical protein